MEALAFILLLVLVGAVMFLIGATEFGERRWSLAGSEGLRPGLVGTGVPGTVETRIAHRRTGSAQRRIGDRRIGAGRSGIEGYCVKHRDRVHMQSPLLIVLKNGTPAAIGTCPDCGTRMYRILKTA